MGAPSAEPGHGGHDCSPSQPPEGSFLKDPGPELEPTSLVPPRSSVMETEITAACCFKPLPRGQFVMQQQVTHSKDI